jgi:hypothetical protein
MEEFLKEHRRNSIKKFMLWSFAILGITTFTIGGGVVL